MVKKGDNEDVHVKVDKKEKKKRKSKDVARDGTSDCNNIRVDDSVELRKEEKKKKREHVDSDFEFDDGKNDSVELRKEEKKKKRKHVESDFEFDDGKNEVVNSKVLPKSCNTEEGEKKKKKKKKHKIETEQVENEYLTSMELKSNDGFNSALEERRDGDKKKKHKEKGYKDLNNMDGIDVNNGKELQKKKQKREKWVEVGSDAEGERSIESVEEAGKLKDQFDGNAMENVVHVKKEKKRKKKKNEDYMDNELRENFSSTSNENAIIEDTSLIGKDKEVENKDEKKAKKRKKVQFSTNVEVFPSSGAPDSSKSHSADKEVENKDEKKAKKRKKVQFSANVQVFSSSGARDGRKSHSEDNLVRGKRFTPEEDEKVMEAIHDYLRGHGLGKEEGMKMIMKVRSHPEVRNCWKEIGAALPYRPYGSIYYRAHTLVERSETREYTTEDLDYIRRYHEQHGPQWRTVAEHLGKFRVHIKDAWRRIKLKNERKGHWTQQEYQSLFDLINTDLQMKAFDGDQFKKYGMLRENISWGAISDKLGTRIAPQCCDKWYSQLISPMVAKGEWANVDDYQMLDTLLSLDACCAEDVDWDNLLEHRSGEMCRKRWKEMVRHIGENRSKTFAEKVEILSERYLTTDTEESSDTEPAVD